MFLQSSSKQANSIRCSGWNEHLGLSFGFSDIGTRLCLASVRIECVTSAHSTHKCVLHVIQNTTAVWVSFSSHGISCWKKYIYVYKKLRFKIPAAKNYTFFKKFNKALFLVLSHFENIYKYISATIVFFYFQDKILIQKNEIICIAITL